MSAGSSSTMFTPAIAASSGSDPCWRRCTARSTARSPFELEIATGPPPPPAGAPFCPRAAPDSAAAAAADPNSFLLLIVMRSMKRRNLHELRGAGAAPARRGRHHLQALRAGLGVGRRRGRLLQDRLGDEVHDQRDDDEVEEAAEQVAVLDRVAARERDGRVCHSPPGRATPTIGMITSSTMPLTTRPTAAPMTTPTASASAFCLSRNSWNPRICFFTVSRPPARGRSGSAAGPSFPASARAAAGRTRADNSVAGASYRTGGGIPQLSPGHYVAWRAERVLSHPANAARAVRRHPALQRGSER